VRANLSQVYLIR